MGAVHRPSRIEAFRSLRFLLLFCGAWIAAGGCIKPATLPQTTKVSSPFTVEGYLPDYRIDAIPETVGASLTDLIYFSLRPDASGGLLPGVDASPAPSPSAPENGGSSRGAETKPDPTHAETGPDPIPPAHQEKLLRMKDRYRFRLLVAVGGWGRSEGFLPMSKNPAARQRFARSLIRFCRANRFDGVDLDWEGDTDDAAYALLLTELHRAFAPRHLLLTVALASSQNPGPDAYRSVDRIHVMAYDHNPPDHRHSTLADAEADLKAFTNRAVPASKLVLGIPFYGRGLANWDDTKAYGDLAAAFHPGPGSDEAGGYDFNGPSTVCAKTRYARSNGFGGVMIWELGQDGTGGDSLLNAIRSCSKTAVE